VRTNNVRAVQRPIEDKGSNLYGLLVTLQFDAQISPLRLLLQFDQELTDGEARLQDSAWGGGQSVLSDKHIFKIAVNFPAITPDQSSP
jgi:hypothetical protein